MVQMPDVSDKTFRQALDELAVNDPDHLYCIFQNQRWTIGTLNDKVNRLANALLAQGLQRGDHVGLMLPAHPDHIIAIFALAKIGLVRIPINSSLKGAALSYPFETFAVAALIADAQYQEALQDVLEKHPLKSAVWRSGGSHTLTHNGHVPSTPHTPSFEDMLAFPDASAPAVFPAADDIIAITPSSGTTGAPKGVLKSDRTLRAGPMAVLKLTGAQPGERFLLWEALHHGAGVAVCIAAVLGRLTLGMVERFSASQFWRQAHDIGASRVHYLGSVLPMVLKQPPAELDKTHGVKIAWGGGCPPEIWPTFERRFGVKIHEGYGLSEMVTFCLVNLDGKVGAIGKPLSWFDAMVADTDGNPCQPGVVGELCIHAKHQGLHFLGYFNNEQASQESRRGEWFRTGDLVRQDEEGYFYFAGRAKDSIRRRGINISAWEVERVLLDHPAIEEIALIGVPSDLGEDDIKVFVRLVQDAQLSETSLLKWCETRLPYFQWPRYVEFTDDFPRTPTQRIRKAELSRAVSHCWDLETSGLQLQRNAA